MRTWNLSLLACLVVGCTTQYVSQNNMEPEEHVRVTTLQPTRFELVTSGSVAPSWAPAPPPSVDPDFNVRAARVMILQSSHIDRLTEVIGVVDVHSPSGGQDAALAALRIEAAARGADAVLGVEFHHGEGGGEATHLSGLAVKFLSSLPD